MKTKNGIVRSLITIALSLLSVSIQAETEIANYKRVEGSDGAIAISYTVHIMDNGVEHEMYKVIELFDSDGTHWKFIDLGNPNPEGDDETTPGDADSLEQLALQNSNLKGIIAGKRRELDPKSPLGKYLTSKGVGLAPVWNPGDVAGKENEFESAVGNGGFGYDPNGGSLGEQLQKKKNKKGNKDDEGGSNGDDPNAPFKPFGDLPGPPELVNPAWKDVSPGSSEDGPGGNEVARESTTQTVSAPPARSTKKGMIQARKYSSYHGEVVTALGANTGPRHADVHTAVPNTSAVVAAPTLNLRTAVRVR